MSFLKKAVLEGNSETVKHLLFSGANPNIRDDKYGTTLLHVVPSPEIAKELIKFGAVVEINDSFGRTPLCCAAANSLHLEVVKVLLSAGAKVNVRMKIGNTPLHVAANVEIVKVLLSHGAEVNTIDRFGRTPIHSALIDGKGFDVFMTLLSAGADINVKMGTFENCLLHYADTLSFTRELLFHGADVYAEKTDGQTPLHNAVRHMKETAVVMELLKWGAQVNVEDNQGETPLAQAIRCPNKNFEVIKELLKYGGDINYEMFDYSLLRYCTIIESAVFHDLLCAKLLVKIYMLKNWNEFSVVEIELHNEIHSSNGKELSKYKDECVSELIKMKSDKMFVKFTLFELIHQNYCLKPIYGSYKTIENILISKYPIYHNIILEEVKKGLERGRLLARLEQLQIYLKFRTDDKKEIELNCDCILMIARYLNDSEILNLIIAFEIYYFHQ